MTNSKLTMFRYLNRLRSQGRVDVIDLGSTLTMAFDLDLRDGQAVVTEWKQWLNQNATNVNL